MAAAAAPPLQYNSRTGEPFIRLPSPHENLILTPPRPSDVAANYSWMTDPKVYKMLEGPPFPYLESNAISWNEIITTQAAEAMREFQEAQAAERSTGTKTFVGTCPVRYIREVQEDGSDVALGDIDAHRCQFPAVRDPDEKARLAEENNARELGDPDIVWCIGNCLASSHHGKGIMSAALAALMEQWMIPQMGVRKMRVETFESNIGSVRVFEKNGFTLEETVSWTKIINCGETISGYHVLWWKSP